MKVGTQDLRHAKATLLRLYGENEEYGVELLDERSRGDAAEYDVYLDVVAQQQQAIEKALEVIDHFMSLRKL